MPAGRFHDVNRARRPARIDADFAAGSETTGFLQFVGQPGPAIAFSGHVLAAGDQPCNQLQPVDEDVLPVWNGS
jgi:hypothetical protein